MKTRVWCGLDRIETVDDKLKGKRIGLMTNPCGITHDFVSAIDVVHARYNLTALFACEHGIRGDAQAGDSVETYQDPKTGVTVYSVYQGSHRLSAEMLDAFDVFVFDMQDVGVRFYTYLYSLSYAMEECAKAGKPVIVLDRLNPIGAVRTEGTILDNRFSSFVGHYEMPSRHGFTMGEYALYAKDYLKLDLDLTIVKMEGYKRSLFLDDTDTPWVAPSPNCPTLHAAMCYIGTCVFEGVNVSEGRGTTLPFELIGAPWIDADKLEACMKEIPVPGVWFRATSFVPTFSKYEKELCYGVQMHITDRETMEPFNGAMYLLDTIREMYPDKLTYREWSGKYAIDRLLGTDEYRNGLSAAALIEKHRPGVLAFTERAKQYHLYE